MLAVAGRNLVVGVDELGDVELLIAEAKDAIGGLDGGGIGGWDVEEE